MIKRVNISEDILKLIPLFMLAKQNSNYRTEFLALFESMGGVHISEGNTMSNFVW